MVQPYRTIRLEDLKLVNFQYFTKTNNFFHFLFTLYFNFFCLLHYLCLKLYLKTKFGLQIIRMDLNFIILYRFRVQLLFNQHPPLYALNDDDLIEINKKLEA